MTDKEYRMCTRCVMDTTDPGITFDALGVCSHCGHFENHTRHRWFPDERGKKKLEELFEQIKRERKGCDYDCILGLSGGLDSSYVALILKEFDMRPLVVHVDAGWNSELAVHNIEKVVKYCGFDLYTQVMNWPEIKDLQLSYLKASVANQDVVQDHAFFSSLYHFAVQNNIRYVISGGNIATECVFPDRWHHAAMDSINLKAIHKKYGVNSLNDYRTISFFQYYFYYPLIKKMQTIRPLNYLAYNKEEALKKLEETLDYKPYGRKHGESRFTKFFQNYYLPTKFNMDKRRPHFSSMVLTGLMTRTQALGALDDPLYEETELRDDKYFIAKKLNLSVDELEGYVHSPGRHYSEFENWDSKYRAMKKIQSISTSVLGRDVKSYS